MLVQRSFAFVDLSGFTAFTDTHGVHQSTKVLAAFRNAGREIASRRGVRIAKWLGDGAMVVSVDPVALVEAMLEAEARTGLGDLPLALRAGVTVGQALLFEGDDYVGGPVNLAARLCDAASAHEILIDQSVLPYLPPWSEAVEPHELAVRGFAAPVAISRLAVRRSEPCVTDPICGLRIPAAGAVDGRFCSAGCAATEEGMTATPAGTVG